MPVSTIMEADPDKLFEQYTVTEVENILQQINNEIERKKVELRTLVGERYRDLIETADTIGEMKSISEQFIKEIQIMNNDMGSLKFKQGPSFKTESVNLKKKYVSYSVKDAIPAQLSILVDLPELIWSAISSKDYIKAAQLFLLGRHIKTGFSVDKDLSKFVDRLPILDLLWNALTHFPKTILNAAENDLKSLEISSEEACDSLCAMALLDNNELTNRFLSLRLETIANVLKNENELIKTRVLDCYNAIVKSLSILWECFAGDVFGKQLFWKLLPKISGNESRPIIKLLEKGIRLKYLPPIILQFKSTTLYSLNSFNAVDLPSKLNVWLKTIKNLVSKKGEELLKNVVSLHSIEPLTNIQITNYREWDQLLTFFKIDEKFNLWNEIFKPLILERAKELITTHCNEGFGEIVESLNKAFLEDSSFKSDHDLRWFVWKESNIDLEVDIANIRGLQLKAKGVTPKVTNICRKFERNLVLLHDDLSGLYSADVTLSSDNNELKSHQQSVYLKLLLRLKEHTRGLALKDSIKEGQLSVIARFLLAIPELCPTLQKCLNISADSKSTPWEDAKILLETEGMFIWSCWETKVALRLEAVVPVHLRKPTSYADLLNIIPQWDIVWIEEGKEGEETRKSQLRVPSGPSFPLQSVLHSLSTDLAKAHLPRIVSENLMHKLMPKLINSYDPTSPLCQAESLQNLFDVKYLLAQFIPITKKDLTAQCQKRISQIEKNIDPFDLDVFSPYIAANVKSSVLRTQLLFGTYCMVRPNEFNIASNQKMPEDPCTLPLSKSSAWFPLIPVTNPVSKPLHIVKPKSIKSTKHHTSEPTTSETSKTTSSSFLSDWFG